MIIVVTIAICLECHRFAAEGQVIPDIWGCPGQHKRIKFVPVMVPLT